MKTVIMSVVEDKTISIPNAVDKSSENTIFAYLNKENNLRILKRIGSSYKTTGLDRTESAWICDTVELGAALRDLLKHGWDVKMFINEADFKEWYTNG